MPRELFAKLGSDTKKKSGLKYAYIMGFANDYVEYMVTHEACEKGVYDSFITKLSSVGGKIILDTVLGLIVESN